VKLRLQSRLGDDVRATWLLAIAVMGLGAYFVQTYYERGIADSSDAAEFFFRRAAANEHIVQEAGTLARVQSRALGDLHRVSGERSLSLSTAALVAMLSRLSAAYHVQVMGIEPGTQERPMTAASPVLGDGDLTGSPVTIRARGRFRNLLKFIENLSHHGILLSVSDTQLALADGREDRAEPEIDATIVATLYRLRMQLSKERRHVETAP
jgi:hypothetical protein